MCRQSGLVVGLTWLDWYPQHSGSRYLDIVGLKSDFKHIVLVGQREIFAVERAKRLRRFLFDPAQILLQFRLIRTIILAIGPRFRCSEYRAGQRREHSRDPVFTFKEVNLPGDELVQLNIFSAK